MSDVKKEKKPRTEKQLAHTQKLILMNKERAALRKKQKADGTYIAPPKKEKKIKIKAETLIIKEVVKNEEEPLKVHPSNKIKEPKPLYKQVIKKKTKKKPKSPPPPPESDASTDLEGDISDYDYASDESGVHALSGHYGTEEEYYEENDEEIPVEPNYTPEPEPVIKPVKRRRTYHR